MKSHPLGLVVLSCNLIKIPDLLILAKNLLRYCFFWPGLCKRYFLELSAQKYNFSCKFEDPCGIKHLKSSNINLNSMARLYLSISVNHFVLIHLVVSLFDRSCSNSIGLEEEYSTSKT